MEVYVLNYLCEYEDYPCESFCKGVFRTQSEARKEMENLFAKKREEWKKYADDDDVEETDGGTFMRLFNINNNIDYVRFEIFREELV